MFKRTLNKKVYMILPKYLQMIYQIIAIITRHLQKSMNHVGFTCSKSTMETLDQCVKFGNFEHISHLARMSLLLRFSR